MACSPTWSTVPPMTSSISSGSTPERPTRVRRVWASSSTGWTWARAPLGLPLPTGVRTASTMTASRMVRASLAGPDQDVTRRGLPVSRKSGLTITPPVGKSNPLQVMPVNWPHGRLQRPAPLLDRRHPRPRRREVLPARAARGVPRQRPLRPARAQHRRAARHPGHAAAPAGRSRHPHQAPVQRAPAALRVPAHPGGSRTGARAVDPEGVGRPASAGGHRHADGAGAPLRPRVRAGRHLPGLRRGGPPPGADRAPQVPGWTVGGPAAA